MEKMVNPQRKYTYVLFFLITFAFILNLAIVIKRAGITFFHRINANFIWDIKPLADIFTGAYWANLIKWVATIRSYGKFMVTIGAN